MDDLLKQRLLWAAIGFNFTMITYQVVFNSGMWFGQFSILKLLIGLLIAAAAGGGGYLAAQMTQK